MTFRKYVVYSLLALCFEVGLLEWSSFIYREQLGPADRIALFIVNVFAVFVVLTIFAAYDSSKRNLPMTAKVFQSFGMLCVMPIMEITGRIAINATNVGLSYVTILAFLGISLYLFANQQIAPDTEETETTTTSLSLSDSTSSL